jgi:hypothetical protein
LLVLVWVLTQLLLQKVWPDAQLQLPPLQLRPPLQVVPQAPQFAESVLVLTQLVPHSVPLLQWQAAALQV